MSLTDKEKVIILSKIAQKPHTKWDLYNILRRRIGITPQMIFNFLKKSPGVEMHKEGRETVFYIPLRKQNNNTSFCPPTFIAMSANKYDD